MLVRIVFFFAFVWALQGLSLAQQQVQDPELREKQASSVKAGETHRPRAAVTPVKASSSSTSDLAKIENNSIKKAGHSHTAAKSTATHVSAPKGQAATQGRNKSMKFSYRKPAPARTVSGTKQASQPH